MRESILSVGNLKNLLRFIILVFIAWGVYEYFLSYRIIYYECNGVTITRINEDGGRYYFVYGRYNYFNKKNCKEFLTGREWGLDSEGTGYLVFHSNMKVEIILSDGPANYDSNSINGNFLRLNKSIDEYYEYDSLISNSSKGEYAVIKIFELVEQEKEFNKNHNSEIKVKY